MARCRDALQAFRRRFPALNRRLFLQSLPVFYRGELLKPARDLALVEQQGYEWGCSYVLHCFQGLFIVTDSLALPERERVFPLSSDESLLLARKLNVRPGDVVADLGTRYGIYALCSARKARQVLAPDINDRALAYARFSAAFNGLEDRIWFSRSDVFQNLNG